MQNPQIKNNARVQNLTEEIVEKYTELRALEAKTKKEKEVYHKKLTNIMTMLEEKDTYFGKHHVTYKDEDRVYFDADALEAEDPIMFRMYNEIKARYTKVKPTPVLRVN